jgi:hypothetical protein
VISRIDLRGDALPEGPALRDLLPRADFDVAAALEKVRPICEAVHHRGDAALIDFAEKFDRVRLESVRVPTQALKDALEQLDPAVRAALEESVRRARLVHREQRRATHTTQVVPGGSVTEPPDTTWVVCAVRRWARWTRRARRMDSSRAARTAGSSPSSALPIASAGTRTESSRTPSNFSAKSISAASPR